MAKLWRYCYFIGYYRPSLKALCLFLYLSEDFFYNICKLDYMALFWADERKSRWLLFTLYSPGNSMTQFFFCCSVAQTRENVIKYGRQFLAKTTDTSISLQLSWVHLNTSLEQFLIDPSADSDFAQGAQQKMIQSDDVFKHTRTWCYALQRMKLQLTGKFRKILLDHFDLTKVLHCFVNLKCNKWLIKWLEISQETVIVLLHKSLFWFYVSNFLLDKWILLNMRIISLVDICLEETLTPSLFTFTVCANMRLNSIYNSRKL